MRTYFYSLLLFILTCSVSSCSTSGPAPKAEARTITKYPEKGNMILLTDRPPQLETPLNIFKQDITPNEYFFVRWHLSEILSRIDIDTFRLYINGGEKPLALSMQDLKTKFPQDSLVALAICAGNSRSTFNPRVPGSQWTNGAMGNAKWKGVKVKYLLEAAGIKNNAVDVSFHGMDKGAIPGVPPFAKSLDVAHAMDGEVLVAYEMNGQDIPMLNGFPLKLVVPGWYATYWVGALNTINILPEKFHGFWMDKAYQVAKNPALNELPNALSKETVPLTNINLHSIFVTPEPAEKVAAGKACHVEGLAFNDGSGISKVECSTDDGKTWSSATLNPEIGKYSWRRWKYEWTPEKSGTYHLAVRATDTKGAMQPQKQWNRSGYGRGFIEHIDVQVN